MSRGFRTVSASTPCAACGKPDWCAWTPDGWLKCERSSEPPNGMRLVSPKDGGGLFAPIDVSTGASGYGPRFTPAVTSAPAASSTDWSAQCARFVDALSVEALGEVAAELGVSPAALKAIGWGSASRDDLQRLKASGANWYLDYPEHAFSCPERDGAGAIVGVSFRAPDGRKGAPAKAVGARRGLVIPNTLKDVPGPVLVVEGASDVAAAVTLGLAAVGRPSNASGAEELAKLLEGREVIILGENDMKEHGAWPGRDGARRVAERISGAWNKPVPWSLPPEGSKDLRQWLRTQVDAGLKLDDAAACAEAGQKFLNTVTESAQESEPAPVPKQADLLVELALEMYRIGLAVGDEPFAVPLGGPTIAIMIRGARDAMRASLAREYRRRYHHVPKAAALADAMTTLYGEALDCNPEPVHVRLARHGDAVVLDLGRADGRVAVIRPGSWTMTDQSPVLFRRTALTGELAEPVHDGDLRLLRQHLNVTDDSWPLVKGYLIAALLPEIPHPVLMLGGEQGTGKTTAAKFVFGTFDASSAPVRSPPKDPEQWAIAAANSWGVVVDNVSHIPEWWSDALCKVVTGDGWLRRRLYTDGDVAVLSFRRVVALTSIDPGALRGDLADRLLIVDLQRISDRRRLSETRLEAAYRRDLPRIIGGLLDLVAAVLAKLPSVELTELPRMADFAVVLAAMDLVEGSNSLALFIGQRGRIAADVLDADPVGAALCTLIAEVGEGEWSGSMKDLHARLTPAQPPKGWPRNAKALSGSVRRLAPALRHTGIEVIVPRHTDKTRRYVLRTTARTAQPPEDPSVCGSVPSGAEACERGDEEVRAIDASTSADRPPNRPNGTGPWGPSSGDSGRSGGSGGSSGLPSTFEPTGPCRACGQTDRWRQAGSAGTPTCGSCHPPAPGLSIEWLDRQLQNQGDAP